MPRRKLDKVKFNSYLGRNIMDAIKDTAKKQNITYSAVIEQLVIKNILKETGAFEQQK